MTQNDDWDKQTVIEVISRNLEQNLHDIDGEAVSPTSSMRDFGANSLDIIEVVSASMRELEIRVPRSELTQVENIEELADKFMEYL